MKARDPKSSAEWQEAVDAAAGLRAIADCKMYGLIEGGPQIDIARCDEMLSRGAARAVYPSKSTTELALELIHATNKP